MVMCMLVTLVAIDVDSSAPAPPSDVCADEKDGAIRNAVHTNKAVRMTPQHTAVGSEARKWG